MSSLEKLTKAFPFLPSLFHPDLSPRTSAVPPQPPPDRPGRVGLPPSRSVPLRGTNLGALRRFGQAQICFGESAPFQQGPALHPQGEIISP